MRYLVRCCCEPDKILGYLTVPHEMRNGERYPICRMDQLLINARPFEPSELVHSKIETALFRTLINADGNREIAVYSDDRPIEFWRGVRGFEEVVAGTGVEPA
ncbi:MULTISPECIES: hypothetical protein [unclassified Bradyrhizobium]|uniref:hypothetical protein n=1 Tax=Bradyrhizobium sp. USDA 4541 TaxID=2817704 RepID=UPI0020A39903|nr:hypothetical protein [Bradyrhizobium sp. USDA 4541]